MKRNEPLGLAFGAVARLFDRELRSALSEFHVLPGQLPVLLELYERDGMTQTELARAVEVEQPTMAGTLKRMEEDGLIRRRPDRDDGRRTGVFLTPAARRLERGLDDVVRRVNRRALRGLAADERRLIYELPSRLRDNLGY